MKRKKRIKHTRRQKQNIHARKRALQRLGMRYNRYVRREIVDIIQSGKAELIQKQTNRVSKYRITYQGQTFDVCYDNIRKTIITFLPNKEEEDEGRE